MKKYFLKRLLMLIPILIVVFTVVFFVMHLTPGDPASVLLGQEATQQQVEQLREKMNLDAPLYQQYTEWVLSAIQGDLGVSYFLSEPVVDVIWRSLPPTIELAIIAELIGIFIALPLGVLAAKNRGSIIDRIFMVISSLGVSIPSFILGLFFVLIFAVYGGWLPVSGFVPLNESVYENLRHLVMPAVALGAMQTALIARMSRSSVLDILGTDFIKAIRAKGVKEFTVVFKHALKNALLPILTVIGQSFGGLITGAVVTETIFNIPGIGQLIIDSIGRRDITVIQGTVLFVTTAFVFINLFVDLLYGLIDPRVRLDR